MKESKNLKVSNNKIVVGLYLDSIKHEGQLSECLFGLANQKLAVDVIVLDGGMSEDELAILTKISNNPSVKLLKTNEEGNPIEEIVEAKSGIELRVVKSNISSFSKVFNDIFNIALKEGYEGMSLVEVGDLVGENCYKNASAYMDENEEVGFFLPMIKNWQNGGLVGLMNEASWAEGMAEEPGKFDMNLLLRFNCANPLGAVYRISELEKYSEEREGVFYPMKESVRISHYYEFFLRMAYNDVKMMTIPRIGYDFRVDNRQEFSHTSSKIPNNLTSIAPENGGVSPQEISFWMELVKKEYFFDEDRSKTYSETI